MGLELFADEASLHRVVDASSNGSFYRPWTVGMIDMGGGSVQIAYEIDERLPRLSEHLMQPVNLGCQDHDSEHQYRLYVATFLGYGANVAIQRYEEAMTPKLGAAEFAPVVRDPCLPTNLVKTVHLSTTTTEANSSRTRASGNSFTRKGTGQFVECLHALESLVNVSGPCREGPCSINGVHQPPINHSTMRFFGFSEFWYSNEDALGLDGRYDGDEMKQVSSVSRLLEKMSYSLLRLWGAFPCVRAFRA